MKFSIVASLECNKGLDASGKNALRMSSHKSVLLVFENAIESDVLTLV